MTIQHRATWLNFMALALVQTLALGPAADAAACTPAGPQVTGMAPMEGATVPPSARIVIATVGLWSSAAPQLLDAEGAVVALQEVTKRSTGLFGSLWIYRPVAPLAEGTYTARYEYESWGEDGGLVERSFTVAGAAATTLSPPGAVEWRARRFGEMQDNTCHQFSETHEVTLTPPAEALDRVVWYEVVFTDSASDTRTEALLHRSFARWDWQEEAGPADVLDESTSINITATCLTVTAVDELGNRSEPVELCQPTQCLHGEAADDWDNDWTKQGACGEEPGTAALPETAGCTAAGRPLTSPLAVLALGLLLLVALRRSRPESPLD